MIQQFLTRIQSRMKTTPRAPIQMWNHSKCSPRLIKHEKSTYEPQNSPHKRENCVQRLKKRTRNSPKCWIRIRSDIWSIPGWNGPELVLEINRYVPIEISFDSSSFMARNPPKSQSKFSLKIYTCLRHVCLETNSFLHMTWQMIYTKDKMDDPNPKYVPHKKSQTINYENCVTVWKMTKLLSLEQYFVKSIYTAWFIISNHWGKYYSHFTWKIFREFDSW